MKSFGELLTDYMRRTGISDSELARSIGVQRQTIFRWKEGSVARPRVREDVLRCAVRLRLSPEERDILLLAAGFPPENSALAQTESSTGQSTIALNLATATQEQEQTDPQVPEAESTLISTLQPEHNPQTNAANRQLPKLYRWLPDGIILILLGLLAWQVPGWLRSNYPATTPTPVEVTIEVPPTETTAPTPLPTPTIEQAKAGEALILIAEFENFTGNQGYNMAGRLQEALLEAVRKNDLANVRTLPWTQNIRSEAAAKQLLTQSKATLVIWGEYDSGRVVIRYADRNDQQQVEQTLKSPDQLPIVINNDTPKEVQALALATLGQIYHKGGEQQKAKDVLFLALALNPEAKGIRARALFYLALISETEASAQQSKELFDQAIDYYTQLAALNLLPEKDWVNVWYNRGNTYLERSRLAAKDAPELDADLTAAIADYDTALRILPNYWQAILNRGTAHYERNLEGDLDQALANFEEAVHLSPNSTTISFMRGLTRLRNDAASNWEADFLSVAKIRPNDVSIHVALCWGNVLVNQLEKAQIECDKVRQLSNNAAEHADLQAIVLAQSGNLESARLESQRHLDWIQTQPSQLYERLNGPLVKEWIEQLAQGKNPFDVTMLERLRRGD